MNFTFHKWVLNAMTALNPTPMSKLDKCMLKTKIRDWSEIDPKQEFAYFLPMCSAWVQNNDFGMSVGTNDSLPATGHNYVTKHSED